jgi:hypothetical protein
VLSARIVAVQDIVEIHAVHQFNNNHNALVPQNNKTLAVSNKCSNLAAPATSNNKTPVANKFNNNNQPVLAHKNNKIHAANSNNRANLRHVTAFK